MNVLKRRLSYIAFGLCALLSIAAVTFSVADRRNMARAASDRLARDVLSERNYLPADVPDEADTEESEEEHAEEEEDDGWDGEGAGLEVDFRDLLSQNEDTIGWIHIPAIDVSYPLLHYADNNDYYVNRSFDGYYSAAGVIYLECTNKPDMNDPNSLIYGHNMGDGTMFGRLHELMFDDAIREEEPYFYIYKKDGTINRYRIFSYYQTQKGSLTYSTIESDEGYAYYSNLATEQSLCDVEVSFEDKPPIVTLSTCHGGAGTTRRFVVHGVLDGTFDPEKQH